MTMLPEGSHTEEQAAEAVGSHIAAGRRVADAAAAAELDRRSRTSLSWVSVCVMSS